MVEETRFSDYSNYDEEIKSGWVLHTSDMSTQHKGCRHLSGGSSATGCPGRRPQLHSFVCWLGSVECSCWIDSYRNSSGAEQRVDCDMQWGRLGIFKGDENFWCVRKRCVILHQDQNLVKISSKNSKQVSYQNKEKLARRKTEPKNYSSR